MKKKSFLVAIDPVKRKIKFPKSILKQFFPSKNISVNTTNKMPTDKKETRPACIRDGYMIIPVDKMYENEFVYHVDNMIKKAKAYDAVMLEEQKKRDNIDGVYFTLEFDHGDKVEYSNIPVGSFFMYNNRIYKKYKSGLYTYAKRLDDQHLFSKTIKENDELNKQVNPKCEKRDVNTVLCELLIPRNVRSL